MRVGLCGLGEIGQHHLAAIRDSDVAELAAVCDLDEGLLRRDGTGVATFTDFSRMLAEAGLDAVDVCLPHALHRDVAVAALASGCDVLLEKPLAVDLESCDAIAAAAAAASGPSVAVSHNQLFYGPHRRLSALIEAGALGEMRSLYARLWIGGRYGGWRTDPAVVGGGLLMDAGVHRVYMLRALGGPVATIEATMDRPRAEESFTVTLEFESGALGVPRAPTVARPGPSTTASMSSAAPASPRWPVARPTSRAICATWRRCGRDWAANGPTIRLQAPGRSRCELGARRPGCLRVRGGAAGHGGRRE